MSDDPTGQNDPPGPPQWPPTPPPAAPGPPVFVHHGQPPVGASPPPPPHASGLPEKSGADAWPWFYSLTAFVTGFVFAQILIVAVYIVWEAAGGNADEDTWFLVIASGINSIVFVFAAVTIARMSGSVSARDFGLVRAPFGQALAKSIGILVTYFILLGIYNELVNLAPDDAAEELGANSGTLGMLAFAILVAVIAPIAEEIFYRGMVFRALANGVGIWLGAIISGILFGAVHIDSVETDRLLQVVPLTLLGIFFAILYVWSGTLFAPIALHATNNALAVIVFAEDQDSTFGIVVAVVLWLAMIAFCTFGWRLTDKRDPDPPTSGLGIQGATRYVPPPPESFFAAPERPDQTGPPS